MQRWLVVFAALACAKTTQRPALVRASARADGVLASWQPALGAAGYRAQLFDLDSGAPLSAAVVTQETQALLAGGFSKAAGVRVTALPGESAIGFVGAGAEGGDGSAWQLFAPEDFRGGALHARFDSLGADERLAVLLVNAGGRDGAQASVEIDGASTVAQVPAMPRSAPQRALALHAPELTEVPPAAPSEPLAERRSFCVVPGLDFSRHLRKPATRAVSSAHAEFYVDDEDAAEYDAAFLPALAQTFESRVWPSVTSAFGLPTDVDQNGKLLVLLSHELGAHLNGGWLIGYFGNSDLLNTRDDSDDCSGGGSNHGEIIFLNDLANGAANGWSADTLGATIFPGTLAHELQHLLNLGHRCVDRACDGPQPTWLNEALSKVAEDLAGFGWSGDQGRADGAEYLGRSQGDLRGYDGRSLTKWEGDPIGNYQGAHSFLRLFADRLGPSLPAAVASGDLEDALGRPLPRAMAEWATALLMSNETGAAYSFSGTPWSPLHQRLRHLDTLAPGAVTLRADGISAVMSGVGQAGPAEVIVRSSEEIAPHVVVIRAPASLPSR